MFLLANVRAFDETRDNIRRSTDEAGKEIPRYTQAVNDIKSKLFRLAEKWRIVTWNRKSRLSIHCSRHGFHLQRIHTECFGIIGSHQEEQPSYMHVRLASSLADNTIAVTRLVNNTAFANMEVFRPFIQRERHDAKEFSRINVNTAKA
jgi:hypothetical protein